MGCQTKTAMTALLLVTLSMWKLASANLNAKGFIRTKGTKFVDANCEQFVVNGWNSWELIEGILGRVSYTDYSVFEGQDPLQWMLDKATNVGMNTFRIFGHGHDKNIMTLQYSPGNYDQNVLYGLDVLLDEAAKRNLRVILSFADNWKDTDSKQNYQEWSGLSGYTDAFWYDEGIQSNYKNHINFMVTRSNSVNGRVYRDDPTILAWNLINEPRSESSDCNPECQQMIQSWIEEMSMFLKSIDPNHMVTIGEEGFYGWYSGKEHVNPDARVGKSHTWAMKSGQSFVPNHSGTAIDFAATHIWVDDWGVTNDPLGYFGWWIDEHANDARALNKPLLIEEFGKKVDNDYNLQNDRDPYYALAYSKVISSLDADDVIQGVMWWEWENDESSPLEQYHVKTFHSTWTDQIAPNSATMLQRQYFKPLVPNCVPGGVTSFDAVFLDQDSDEFVYYIYRENLLAINEGKTMVVDGSEFVEGIPREDCALRCEQAQPKCNSFAYNEGQRSCFLKKNNSKPNQGFVWSSDGWSTHFRQVGSYDCNEYSACTACTKNNVCVRCSEGYVLDRYNDPTALPFCRYSQED
eukprot:TRINITY_DN7725_c0_g1_i4.p1 TRINITY_DN7725_c0_g1~~TRINITY_DN7725_c0_g1_i4.p1  ORF type:complete len:577 (+),score=44.64 TRINITY_DN7725_c0_g1_i4:148-1878(+)